MEGFGHCRKELGQSASHYLCQRFLHVTSFCVTVLGETYITLSANESSANLPLKSLLAPRVSPRPSLINIQHIQTVSANQRCVGRVFSVRRRGFFRAQTPPFYPSLKGSRLNTLQPAGLNAPAQDFRT